MKLHPREIIVRDADRKFHNFMSDLRSETDLTIGEIVMMLSLYLAQVAKYQIRWERHGDTSEPGGRE